MSHSESSEPGGGGVAVSRFRCGTCGRSIHASRALTVGRQVRCPSCGVQTQVVAESPEPEPNGATWAGGAEKVPTPGRSGIGPTPMASPSPSQKAAAANYPAVRGYTLLGEIGRGATGAVYRARHDALKRLVALKILSVGGEGLAAVLGEAEAVAKLHHPNIVQIFEVGEGDGPPYIALEYVAGGTLRSRTEGKPQPIRASARLVETLARAVQAAHARGLVHRDLKPANVLLGLADPSPDDEPGEDVATFGVAKIADFGLAMKLDRDEAWGSGHEMAGTPQYMAPEQALGRGEQLGPGVDIYSLGVILYELITGRRPSAAPSVGELLHAIAEKPPVPPRQVRKAIPRDLEAICLKCLAKDPRDRYRTASALANDLHRYLQGEPVKARPSGPLGRSWLWSLRNPTAASLIGAAAVVFGLGLPSLGWLKRGIVRVAALEDAENQSRAVLGVWDIYSKVIGNVDRALAARPAGPAPAAPMKTTGTDFDLTFRDTNDGRLVPDPTCLAPAPVTFIKIFGQKLDHPGAVDGDSSPTSSFRVYSDFPLRKNDYSRPESGFGRKALDALTGDKDRKSYSQFLSTRKGEILHAAFPVVMRESCLKCHNDQSKYDPKLYEGDKPPKLDWKEGQVRGVIEVVRPMDDDYEKTGDLLTWALGGVLLAGTTLLVGGRSFLGLAGRRDA